MQRIVKAGVFKAECLQMMDQVKKNRETIIITKRNEPVAKLVPVENEPITLFGKMRGTVHIIGNILSPIDEEWDANH
jgi:prevent-host-death family protein